MKKYLYIALSTLMLISCSYKEDDVFSQKPSERNNSILQKYKSQLEAPNTYWVLSSYPGESNVGFWVYPYNPTVFATERDYPRFDRSIGGYNYIVKFADGKVTASSEVLKDNTEDTSYFRYTITEGPTLSFDTYSKVLHHFSFVSNCFPKGRGGDIDFIFLKEENGVFTLRGRTSNNLMTLRKLKGDRETFLNKLRENTNTLKNKALSPISVNGTEVNLKFFPTYRQIAFLYNNNQKYEQRAFLMTEKGFKLYEPVTINGITFSEFYINNTKTGLTTPDGTITTSFVTSPFIPTDNTHQINFSSGWVSPILLNYFNRRKRAIAREYGANFVLSESLYFIPFANGNDCTSVYQKYADVSGYNCYYEADFVGVAGEPNQVEILFRDIGEDYYNYIYFFSDVKNLLLQLAKYSPYKVEDQNNGYYIFTSARNDEVWFYIKK